MLLLFFHEFVHLIDVALHHEFCLIRRSFIDTCVKRVAIHIKQ